MADYPYDGKGSNGVGTLGPLVDGRTTVELSEFRIPHLQIIPGLDALLMGVAQVPFSDDPLTHFMPDLPNNAVCELPVHLHLHGGERPVCPL